MLPSFGDCCDAFTSVSLHTIREQPQVVKVSAGRDVAAAVIEGKRLQLWAVVHCSV
jgi:hypothetical protein